MPWRFRAETDRKLPWETPCQEIVRTRTTGGSGFSATAAEVVAVAVATTAATAAAAATTAAAAATADGGGSSPPRKRLLPAWHSKNLSFSEAARCTSGVNIVAAV